MPQTTITRMFNYFEKLPLPVPRRLLASKRILLISGGTQERIAQYRQLHERGLRVVLVDSPDHWAKIYLDQGLIEAFIPVDLSERKTLFDEILNALIDSGFSFDTVLSFSDSTMLLARRLAYAMGLDDDFEVIRH